MMGRGPALLAAYAAYGALGAAAWWWTPAVIDGAGVELSAVAGLAVFLVAALIHEAVARRAQARQAREALQVLRKAQSDLGGRIGRLRAQLSELQSTMGVGDGGGGKPDMVGEMRVIRGLLKKLTDKQAPGRGDRMTEDQAPEAHAGELSATEILEIIRLALENNRVDLCLQPVVSLPQRQVRYYEVFSRIRHANGSVILPQQYLDVAAQTGLIATIDNLLLFRCIQLVRRVQRDKLDVGFFCNLSRHALADPEFFPQLVDFLERNSELAQALVFELSQRDAGDPAIGANLARLRGLGFVFSMDNVSGLELDFDELARRRFKFVKIEAGTLLSAQAQARMTIHVADLKEAMERAGIALIAEKVEQEPEVVGLLEFNVDLGQGYLFGEPLPMREAV